MLRDDGDWRAPYVGGAKLAAIWPQDEPSGWQDGRKYTQDDPKMGEVGTKTTQMRFNLAPMEPRLSQIWPQECMKADIARIYENQ